MNSKDVPNLRGEDECMLLVDFVPQSVCKVLLEICEAGNSSDSLALVPHVRSVT